MTIDELRVKWENEIERYDRAIEVFEALPAYINGVRHGEIAAIATQRYINQMSASRAQLRELLFAYPGEPLAADANAQSPPR